MPDGAALCRELGLGDELVAPAATAIRVDRPAAAAASEADGGGARRIGLRSLRSGILSPAGLARAASTWCVPPARRRHDVSIGQIVRSRLGSQAYDRLIDPLLGGIHAGSCDELSARATAPQLGAALGGGRGLVRGLRAMVPAPPAGAPAPVFLTLRGGLAELVGELGKRFGEAAHPHGHDRPGAGAAWTAAATA